MMQRHCSRKSNVLPALSSFTLQIFALLDVGEQIAKEIPAVLERLPQQLLSMRKKILLDFVTETRATFAAFCVSLSQDLQRHSGQDFGYLHVQSQM